MNKKKYKLTISILASNRKDTLPKTLESLKPILDNVSSELIVVDTGCDEDLLEVVRKYTDKIIKFTWCNDFSKARNVGIENAQGDWFMFIDDDEWFEDVTQFIDFFNSDEMKKYNYAKYIVRNYENFEGTAWMDSIAGRMFRLLDGTKFIDAIHERPTNIAGPTKDFTAYAHHYGYVYSSQEEKDAHFERNMTLIKAQVEKEPHVVRHYCHLTQEYNTVNDYDNSIKYAYEGIENADMSINDNKKDLVGLFGNVVWVLVNQSKHEEVLKKSQEYLASPYMNKLGEMALYGFCAIAEYLLHHYDKSIEYVDKFVERYDYLDIHVAERFDMDAILVTSAMEKSNYIRVVGIGMTASATIHNETALVKYAELLDFSEVTAIIDGTFCMEYIVDMMRETTKPYMYVNVVQNISCHNGYLGNLINKIMMVREENYGGFLKIAGIMEKTTINHGYIQYLRIISTVNNGEVDKLQKLYEQAVHDISDIVDVEHEFWQIAKDNSINVGAMIEKQPIYRFNNAVDQWVTDVKIKKLIEKVQDLSSVLPADGIHMKYFGIKIAEAFLVRKKLEGISLGELKAEIKKYYVAVISFYRGIYKEVVFDMYDTILPKNCQAAILMMKMEEESDKGTLDSMICTVRSLMPNLSVVMDKYAELI